MYVHKYMHGSVILYIYLTRIKLVMHTQGKYATMQLIDHDVVKTVIEISHG